MPSGLSCKSDRNPIEDGPGVTHCEIILRVALRLSGAIWISALLFRRMELGVYEGLKAGRRCGGSAEFRGVGCMQFT